MEGENLRQENHSIADKQWEVLFERETHEVESFNANQDNEELDPAIKNNDPAEDVLLLQLFAFALKLREGSRLQTHSEHIHREECDHELRHHQKPQEHSHQGHVSRFPFLKERISWFWNTKNQAKCQS
jgi:hypothetical protein